METVTINVDPSGNTTISVKGVTGRRCQDVTRDLERLLGKKTGDKLTADYHKREELRHDQRC